MSHDVDTRDNPDPDIPMTVVHQHRNITFDKDSGDAYIGRFTVEYQPGQRTVTEEGMKAALPHMWNSTPEEAVQHVYESLKETLFPTHKNPPLMVQLDYSVGDGLYDDPDNYPHTVTAGRFH